MVLDDVNPDSYAAPFKAGNKWDDRVHDMEHLWHTRVLKHMRTWVKPSTHKVQQVSKTADASTPTFATPLIDQIAGPLFKSLAKDRQFKATRVPNWSELSHTCIYSKYKVSVSLTRLVHN